MRPLARKALLVGFGTRHAKENRPNVQVGPFRALQ